MKRQRVLRERRPTITATNDTSVVFKFSLEVLLRIVCHLNHYSIQSLLTAVPEYCEYAVLVTDHDYCPLFFNVKNVKRLHFPSYWGFYKKHRWGIRTRGLFTPQIARTYPIRLFEIYDKDQHWVSVNKLSPVCSYDNAQNNGKLDAAWVSNPGINNKSFVFVDLSYYINYYSYCERLCAQLDIYTGCKWHTGFPTNPPQEGISQLRWPYKNKAFKTPGPVYSTLLPSQHALFQSRLVTLRLENVAVFKDIELPFLMDLVLVYNDPQMEEVPIIEGPVVPILRRFVVHYCGELPLFRKMGRLGSKMFDWEKKRKTRKRKKSATSVFCPAASRSFELCHIAGNIRSLMGTHHTDRKRSSDDLSFPFMERFQYAILSGIPWYALVEMKFPDVLHLILTMTDTAGECPRNFTFEAPRLSKLTITIKTDDLVLPRFHLSSRLGHLIVQILALNPNLEGLWESPFYRTEFIDVYSDPTLPAQAASRNKTMYAITAEEKKKIFNRMTGKHSTIRFSTFESNTRFEGFP